MDDKQKLPQQALQPAGDPFLYHARGRQSRPCADPPHRGGSYAALAASRRLAGPCPDVDDLVFQDQDPVGASQR